MKGNHKSRQNSESKRKALLASVTRARTEAQEIGAANQLVKQLDSIGTIGKGYKKIASAHARKIS